MTTAGPNYPTNSSSVSQSGDAVWANPSNANASDGANASSWCDGLAVGYTDILKTLGYGFSIPSGATINGIMVEIRQKADTTPTELQGSVALYKAGVVAGSGDVTPLLTDTAATVTLGGASDLWGTTWTPAEINDAGFGVYFHVSQNLSIVGDNCYVDFIRVTIDYTPVGDAVVNGSGDPGDFFFVMEDDD